MRRTALVLTLVLPGASAWAKAAPVDVVTLAGSAAFEWTRPNARCRTIDGKLQKKLADGFVCEGADPDGASTASGKPLKAACHAKKGRAEYLVFGSAEDCRLEQETQAANAE